MGEQRGRNTARGKGEEEEETTSMYSLRTRPSKASVGLGHTTQHDVHGKPTNGDHPMEVPVEEICNVRMTLDNDILMIMHTGLQVVKRSLKLKVGTTTPEKLDPFWSFLSWSLRTLIPAVNGSETLSPLWKVVLEPCLRVPHDGTGSRKLVTTQTDDIENNVRVPGMIEIATIPNRRRMNQLLLQLHHVEIPARFNDEFPKTLANEPQEGNETNMTEINISCPSGSHSPEAYDNNEASIEQTSSNDFEFLESASSPRSIVTRSNW
ncbi:hypothetical protein K435DRAFT_797427 [Dendrothele bispora CBS 962.96]|uniref:Uncharacterized protein n=1 Tax=Dendrothele bispora (strain CBS 962.96) TaxID=1314807 RepID=A0A4S8M2F6_DENBC|nr:hypothetical protein K435DRAFT_797427 [Dendrothele bispora CBS 962.96]